MAIVWRSKMTPNDPNGNYGPNRVWQTQVGQRVDRSLQLSATSASRKGSGQRDDGIFEGVSEARSFAGPAYASAYDRLMTRARGSKQAQLAITLATSRQSLAMVATRASQLARAISAVRRGWLVDAAEILGKGYTSRARKLSKRRSAADNWLELNFGWAPLYGDIHAAVEALASTPESFRINASGKQLVQDQSWSGKYPGYKIGFDAVMLKTIRLSGQMTSVNPDTLLLSQLGLVNPAAVAWDLVPFSFVVDWFIPVNKFINSMTADLGITLGHGSASYRLKKSYSSYTIYDSQDDQQYNQMYVGQLDEWSRSSSSFPLPTFADRLAFPSWDAWRATTSIALLTQQLTNLRKA